MGGREPMLASAMSARCRSIFERLGVPFSRIERSGGEIASQRGTPRARRKGYPARSLGDKGGEALAFAGGGSVSADAAAELRRAPRPPRSVGAASERLGNTETPVIFSRRRAMARSCISAGRRSFSAAKPFSIAAASPPCASTSRNSAHAAAANCPVSAST